MALHIVSEHPPSTQADPDRHERARIEPIIHLRGSFEDRLVASEIIGRIVGSLYCLYYLMIDGTIELSIEPGQVTTGGEIKVFSLADEMRLNWALDRIHRIAEGLAQEYGELLAVPLELRATYTCTFF